MNDLQRQMATGQVILLDGGIGGELQQRGVKLDEAAWSATAHLNDPDVVLDVHRDYLDAGAQIITTNTFSAAKHVLEAAGLGDNFERINSDAVKVARQACEMTGRRDIWVAGSISTIPPLDNPENLPDEAVIQENFREQAKLLASSGVDLLIAELLVDSAGATMAVKACVETGLPVWVGLSAQLSEDDGSVNAFRPSCKYGLLGDETLTELAESMTSLGASAIGIMHTKTSVMAPALRELSKVWQGPKLAYAEIRHHDYSDWDFEPGMSPEEYAQDVMTWIRDFDVQIVGGCCGTRPDHIREIRKMLDEMKKVA